MGLLGLLLLLAADDTASRVEQVRATPGFVALWDFVKRDPSGRFAAHQAPGDPHDFTLDAVNYVRDYWNRGRTASYDDFPLLGRGPFGQALRFRAETDPDFRPCLLMPRARLHNSGLDIKGPGQSVSMVVWLIRESGDHALAGIWHEGTDLRESGDAARKVEPGMRQYALFAGLAANHGAAAAHVSENGASSFGDRYARNLAVTPEVIPTVPAGASPELLDRAWTVVALSYDNARRTVTAYLNGKASDLWIDDPARHPFYQWPAKAWPHSYQPPETKPLHRTLIGKEGDRRVELHTFAFTKVRVTYKNGKVVSRELAALKANPFWFGHDLYTPRTPAEGGPFTIGRVIHSGRNAGVAGYIGGVAVFNRALSAKQMRRLAAIATRPLPHPR